MPDFERIMNDYSDLDLKVKEAERKFSEFKINVMKEFADNGFYELLKVDWAKIRRLARRSRG